MMRPPLATRSRTAIAIVLALLVWRSAVGQVIRLADGDGRNRVRTAGACFAAGRLRDGMDVLVGKRRQRAQWTPVFRWPDGSIRAAQVSFVGRVGRGRSSSFELTVRTATASRSDGPVRTTSDPEGIRVESDVLSFLVPPDVTIAFRDLARRKGPGVLIARATLGAAMLEGEVVIERDGPLEVVVVQRGVVAVDDVPEPLGVTRRITARAGADSIDVETWLLSTASLGRSAPIDLVLEPLRTPRVAVGPVGRHALTVPVAMVADARGRLSWLVDGVDQEADPSELAGALGFVRGPAAFGVSVRDFELLTPGHVSAGPDGFVRVGVVSDAYVWWPGVRPHKAVRVHVPEPAARWRSPPRFRDPVPLPDPGDHPLFAAARGGAALAPSPALHALRERVLAELAWPACRDNGLFWPGEENAGDWRWSRSDAGNLEYDTTWGLLAVGGRDRDETLVARAILGARHLVSRDLDLARTGLPLRHGRHHRQGGIEPGHVWVEGLLAAALITADPWLLESVRTVFGGWREHLGGLDLSGLNTRSLGWGLLDTAVIAEWDSTAGDLLLVERFQRAIREAVGEDVPLFDRLKGEDRPYHVSPWVTGGILVEAVRASQRVRPAPHLTRRLARAVAEIASRAWDPKAKALRRSLIYSGESRQFLRAAGECHGEESLFFALGLARTAEGGGPSALADLAGEVIAAAGTRLRFPDKTFRGIELSQLLWLLPRLLNEAE